ncbi:MAG: nuclear transport factor 2 family protein [Acidimicrobiia bacterium]
MDDELRTLLAERAITRVLRNYTRAVDRFDWELLRSCYWPGATDDHGTFKGDVDAYVEYLQGLMPRFERTSHQIGQMLVDVDLDAGVAATETYATAHHRIVDDDGARDMVAGVRYVDRFERRGTEWRIAERVVAFDWHRTDPVTGRPGFPAGSVLGERSRQDIAYRILD